MPKKAVYFIVLTYLISFFSAAIFYLTGLPWKAQYAAVFGVLYMYIPFVSAVILVKFVFQESVRQSLGIHFKFNRWFVFAVLIPIISAMLASVTALFLPGVELSPDLEGFYQRMSANMTPEEIQQMKLQAELLPVHPFLLSLLAGLIAGPTVNALAAFGEETGWRGFLQKELAALGFWKTSVITGILWGFWHAPLILKGHNYPEHPLAGVFMMTAFTILLSPIFSYVRIKSGSVFAAAIIHGSLNASGGLAIMLLSGGNDLTVGITGLAGMLALCILNLMLYFLIRKDRTFFR